MFLIHKRYAYFQKNLNFSNVPEQIFIKFCMINTKDPNNHLPKIQLWPSNLNNIITYSLSVVRGKSTVPTTNIES